MTDQDIRWKQRFANYQKACKQLGEFLTEKKLNRLEKQGLIQAFEYTHELAWKTLADFFKERGNSEIYGSKDATRAAFQNGLIMQGELWMSMIKSRNLTSHTYNEEIAEAIVENITQHYYRAFCELEMKLAELAA
jgi:nucleotidyltransferase substrate binding protein (TIGR01987 family)